MSTNPMRFLFLPFAAWLNRRQLDAIAYLREEVRVLREQLGPHRVRFTDAQRHRLAVKGKALGRKVLRAVATVASPDTILGWHRRLVERVARREHARRALGRPITPKDIAKLVLRMARENPTYVKQSVMWSRPDPVVCTPPK